MRFFRFLSAGTLAFACAGGSGDASIPSPALLARRVHDLSSESFETRDQAFAQLLRWGTVHSGEVLAALPSEHPDPEVRERCGALRRRIPTERFRSEALAKVGQDVRTRAVVNAFFDDPSCLAIDNLSRVLGSRVKGFTEILEKFLDHPDPAFRKHLLAVVAQADPSRAAFLAEKEEELDDGSKPAYCLGHGSAPVTSIERRLDDSRDSVKATAAALWDPKQRDDPSTVPLLRGFIEEQCADRSGMDRYLVSLALCSLIRFKDREAAPLFAGLTDGGDLLVRATALRGLGSLGDKQYAFCIARQLDSGEPFIRNAAAAGLALLSGDAGLRAACQRILSMDLEDQIEFFVGLEEDLMGGEGAEGVRPEIKAIETAKTWWKAHRGEDAYLSPAGGK